MTGSERVVPMRSTGSRRFATLATSDPEDEHGGRSHQRESDDDQRDLPTIAMAAQRWLREPAR